MSSTDWKKIALNAVPDPNQHRYIVASIGIGAIIAGIATPIAGGFAAILGFLYTYRQGEKAIKFDEAILVHNKIAPSLNRELLQDYLKEVGIDRVIAEIKWAEDNSYPVSDSCIDLLESQLVNSTDEQDTPLKQIPAIPLDTHINTDRSNDPKPSADRQNNPVIDRQEETDAQRLERIFGSAESSDRSVPPEDSENAPKKISNLNSAATVIQEPIENTRSLQVPATTQDESSEFLSWLIPKMQSYCFIGPPRSGKDYLCSLLAQKAKQLFNIKIFVIDPKGDPDEMALWDGIASEIYSFVGYETSCEDHADHIRKAFKKFKQLTKEAKQIASQSGVKQDRWLLIYNEFTTSSSELKTAKDNFLAEELPKLISMGDSLKMNFWLMAQAPHMNTGIDGGVMGQFARILIVEPERLGTMEGWSGTQLMKGINLYHAKRLFDDSEMRRVVYCSASDPQLRAMPRLTRPYYYCREREMWIGEKPHQPETSHQPEIPTENSPPDRIEPLSLSGYVEPSQLSNPIETIDIVSEDGNTTDNNRQQAKSAIMSFMNNAREKRAKSYNEIVTSGSVRKLGEKADVDFRDILRELIEEEQIVEPIKGFWAIEAWL